MDVRIPDHVTEDLAYISGILMGDGHITISRKRGDYYIKCVGSPRNEMEFHDTVIRDILKRLFDADVEMKLHDNQTTYGFHMYSKILAEFLTGSIGIPCGSKSGIISTPEIFKKDCHLRRSFLRGYADTDFSLTLRRRYRKVRYYPVIVGASKSRRMMEEVAEYLEDEGFRVSRDMDRRSYDKRCGKMLTIHRIQLYGHEQLVLWMEKIGFSNPKHMKRFELWKIRNSRHRWKNVRMIAGSGFEPLAVPSR